MSLIYNMLDLSTYHLSVHTYELLREGTDEQVKSLIFYEKKDPELKGLFEHLGFIVHINEDMDNNDLPEDLKKCIRFAASKGCDWINFDPEGEVEDTLQVYVR